MKSTIPSVLLLTVLLSGCATQSKTGQFVADAATVTGAGAVGYVASDGNAPIAAGSAVVALGVKKFMDSSRERARMAELDAAYKSGMAQAAKRADTAIQNAQKDGMPEQAALAAAPTQEETEALRVPITAPERVINGVRINASQEIITLPK
jgi:hypothetical protein